MGQRGEETQDNLGPGVDTDRSSAARPREVRNQGVARSRYSGRRSCATMAEA